MLRGLPLWALQGLVRPVVRSPQMQRVYHVITNPIVTTVIFLGTLYLWQVPVLHNLAVRNDIVHELMHLSMLGSGFIFWWIVIDPKPHRSRLHHGLRILYLGLIVLPNTLLGAGITFNTNLVTKHTTSSRSPSPFRLSPISNWGA